MPTRNRLLIALSLSLAFCGCAGRRDPLVVALDELKRLESVTAAGIKYPEYAARVQAAQEKVDVALQQSRDRSAKSRIENVLHIHLEAQNAWKAKIDNESGNFGLVQDHWDKARGAAAVAHQFAFANHAQRQQIRAQEIAVLEQATRESEAARTRAEEAERAIRVQQVESEARSAAVEHRRRAEEAEQERTRRFAPDGTVYILKRMTFNTPHGLTSLPPGTELKVIKKSSTGILHVTRGELTTEIPPSAVTNDRDLVATLQVRLRRAVRDAHTRSASNVPVGTASQTR